MEWFFENKCEVVSATVADTTFWRPFWTQFEEILKIRKVDKAKPFFTARTTCQALDAALKSDRKPNVREVRAHPLSIREPPKPPADNIQTDSIKVNRLQKVVDQQSSYGGEDLSVIDSSFFLSQTIPKTPHKNHRTTHTHTSKREPYDVVS